MAMLKNIKFKSDLCDVEFGMHSTIMDNIKTDDSFDEFIYKYFMSMNYLMMLGELPDGEFDTQYFDRTVALTVKVFYIDDSLHDEDKKNMFECFNKTNSKIEIG